MGMKMTMGYVSPAAIQAKRKAVQARREAAKRAIDQRVSEGLATLVDAAVAKVKGETPSPEIDEPKEKAPPPFGLNRPGCSKDFAYNLFDGKGGLASKVITVKTGDRVPGKRISDYWDSKRFYQEVLEGFALGRNSPIGFFIGSLTGKEKYGFGTFSSAFVSDDPRYLAGDLAHINALLAARGLCLVFDPADFNRDRTGALIYEPSAPLAHSDQEPPPFESQDAVTVHWKIKATGLYACIALRHGDRVADHLHDHFHAKKEAYEKILYGYRKAAARSFASPYAGRGADFTTGRLKDYLESIIPGMEAQPLDFLVYDGTCKIQNGVTTYYASHGPERTFFTASRADDRDAFQYLGNGWVPKGITAEQLAHIDCRFAASGLEIRLVPRVEDNLPTEVIDLMWGRGK